MERGAEREDSAGPVGGSAGRVAQLYDALSALLFGVLITVILASFRDYGITWDETWHRHYGDHIIAWYASGFQNRAALSYHSDYLYGGGFDGRRAQCPRRGPGGGLGGVRP